MTEDGIVAPLRERGSKLVEHLERGPLNELAFFTGARIETPADAQACQHRKVAPFTGARIETAGREPLGLSLTIAPFTGARSEIF